MIETTNFGQKLFVLESEKGRFSQSKGWKSIATSNGIKAYEIKGQTYYLMEMKEKFFPFFSLKRILGIAFGCLYCIKKLFISLDSL